MLMIFNGNHLKQFWTKALLLIVHLQIASQVNAQSIVRVVPDGEHVYYATLSPDESLLAVQTLNEHIILLEKSTLAEKVRFRTTRPSEILTYRTGKKTFSIDKDNTIYYLTSSLQSDSLIVSLIKASETGLIDSIQVLSNHRSKYWTTDDVKQIKWNYSIDANDQYLTLGISNTIYQFELSGFRLIRKFKLEDQVDALAMSISHLAYLSNNIISITTLEDNHIIKTIADSSMTTLAFLNDNTLMMAGDQLSKVMNITQDQVTITNRSAYSQINGIQVKDDEYCYSGHFIGFPDNAYGALYQEGRVLGIQNLPTHQGSNSFKSVKTNEFWTILMDGRLFKLSLTPDPPRPMLQLGHGNDITNFSVSKDKRFLLSSSDDRSVIQWDVLNGTIVNRFQTDESLLGAAYFDQDDLNIFYTVGDTNCKKIYTQIPANNRWGLPYNTSIPAENREYIEKLKKQERDYRKKLTAYKRGFDIKKEDSAAYSTQYFAGIIHEGYNARLRLVHLSSKDIQDVDLPDSLTWYSSVLGFYDDQTLLLEGRSNTILLYDCAKKKMTRRLGSIPEKAGWLGGIQKMILTPSGDTLFTVHNNTILQGWNLKKGERFYYLNQKNNMVMQGNTMDYKNGVLTLTLTNNQLQFQAVIDFSTEFGKILMYGDSTFTINQSKTLIQFKKDNGAIHKAMLSSSGDSLLIMRTYFPPDFTQQTGFIETYLDLWDINSMTRLNTIAVGGFKTLPVWEVSKDFRQIFIWDHNATNLKMQKEMGDGLAGSGTLPFIFEVSLFDQKIKKHAMGKLSITRLAEGDVRIKGDEVWVRDDYKTTITKLTRDKWKVIEQMTGTKSEYGRFQGPFLLNNKDDIIYAQSSDVFNSSTTLELFDLKNNTPKSHGYTDGVDIHALSNIAQNNTFAVGLKDHTISIRSADNLSEKYKIVINEKNDYLLLTPEGYYKANRSSSSSIFFNWKNETYSFEQFDLWYNRPDLVLSTTGFYDSSTKALLTKAYKKRVNAYQIQPLDEMLELNIPELSILNISKIPLQTTSAVLSFETAWSSNSVIEHIEVKVNGVPIELIALEENDQSKTLNIQLSSGENKISVKVKSSNGLYSLPKEVKIDYNNPKVTSTVHLITIAVSEYQNNKLNLTYPVKDAKDFINTFKLSNQEVIVDTLFNEQVSKENMLNLKSKLLKTGIDDKVIVFLAGHGMLDNNFDFRFATYGIDPDQPEINGVLYNDIEKLLEGIPARNKLLLIDACHSGKVDKDEILKTGNQYLSQRGSRVKRQTFSNIHKRLFNLNFIDSKGFELMEELFYDVGSSNGSEVIVAAAGNSYALESEEWRNGVFTYAMINGIKTKDADQNLDGKITVDEMQAYLQTEVAVLTDGDQKPRFRSENRLNTFVFWEY